MVIHYAIYGSFERWIGVITEHYAGAFPAWLAPVQAVVIPIADRHVEYAREVREALRVAGIRAEVDERAERMQAKVRAAGATGAGHAGGGGPGRGSAGGEPGCGPANRNQGCLSTSS